MTDTRTSSIVGIDIDIHIDTDTVSHLDILVTPSIIIASANGKVAFDWRNGKVAQRRWPASSSSSAIGSAAQRSAAQSSDGYYVNCINCNDDNANVITKR